ncbi:MAG TPA: hypothetical protein VF733_06390, partial [Candidatus Saccharimonadales bacterium]
MNNSQNNPSTSGGQSYDKPVAYDAQGRPLYAHPPQQQAAPQMVYMARPMNPESPEIPAEIQRRAEESRKRYPHLNLSHGEYIISAVKRHPIGIIFIWAGILLTIGVFAGFYYLMFVNPNTAATTTFAGEEGATSLGAAVLIMISVLALLG